MIFPNIEISRENYINKSYFYFISSFIMSQKKLWILTLSAIWVLTLTWCTSTSITPEEDIKVSTEETTLAKESSEMYTEEEIQAAKYLITEEINHWSFKVENIEIEYDWDELSKDFLLYSQNQNPNIIESASFSVSFYIPEQEALIPRNFEGKRDIDTYVFFLGRTESWEWEIVSDWIW